MLADKPTELSRIKLKTWTRQPVPMISKHSAHLTPLSVDFRTWLWRYTYLLLLVSMLCSSSRIAGDNWNARGPRHQIASRLNARWQTDWTNEDQAKNLNSTARPYDQRAFSPLDPTVSWLSHLALAIYIFVVVNFDALAQASNIQIKRPADWMSLTNLWARGCRLWTRRPVPRNIHKFRCSGTGKRYSNRKETSCVPLQNAGFEPGSQTPNRQQTECSLTNRLSYRGSS